MPTEEAAPDPHDARGALRDSRIRRSIQAGLLAKAVSTLSRMAVVAAAIRTLGAERYGLWVSAGSLVGWLGISDLGLSSGVINAVSRALGADDRRAARRHLSTGYALFALLGLIAAAVAVVASREPALYRMLGVASGGEAADDARFLVLFLGLVFAASLPVGVVVSACSALQQAHLASTASTAAQGATLLAVGGLWVLGDAGLGPFVAAVAIPPLVANLALTAELFGRRHPDLRPAPSAASADGARALAGTSALVLLAQIGDLAIHFSANLVVASHLGPSAVPRYSVPYALFMLAQTVCNTLLGPLWPFYAEAAARGDRAWIARRFRESLVRTLPVMVGLAGGIVAFGPPVIRLWAGEAAVPTRGLLAAMAVYFTLWTVSAITWMLANGLGLFRARALSALASGATFVLGSLGLVERLGLPAIPLAGTLAMVIDCSLGAAALLVWRRGRGAGVGAAC